MRSILSRHTGDPGVIKLAVACIVAAAACLASVAPAEACSCVGPIPACQGVWMAEAVFVGRVLDVTNLNNEPGREHEFLRGRRVTLEVLETFRGERWFVAANGASTVDVLTGQGGGDCGINFKKGESYLVFANTRKTEPTVLQTGLCNRTRELSRAQEDLPYLRTLATSPPRGGRVYGYVEFSDPEMSRRLPGAPPPERKRIGNVRITLKNEAGATVTTISTNASGAYEFTDLAPGKYRVEAALPDIYHYIVSSADTPFSELRDSRGCSEVNLYVTPAGR